MNAPVMLNQGDAGPESRIVVTYQRGGNRCVLPARMIGFEPNGDLLVEVELQDQRSMVVTRRVVRTIHAEELVEVEEVTDAD